MKRITYIILFVIAAMRGYAQNVLTNGSFEQYSTCPTTTGQMSNATTWSNYSAASPDYFNSCHINPTVGVPNNIFGSQAAAQGNAYAGLGNSFTSSTSNYYEYITTTFASLTIGAVYEISMSVSISDNNSNPVANQLGVLFIQNGPAFIGSSNVLPMTPQVNYSTLGLITNKIGWDRVAKVFTADSAYTRLAIGGFTNVMTAPAQWVYYYIDSVVLKRMPLIHLNYPGGPFCAGDTIHVPYKLQPNLFGMGNVFTLQLSGPTGSFATPINIGNLTTTSAGTIDGVLPASLATGTGYRVRIVSTNIVDTSLDNGSNLQITSLPTVTASSNSPVCEGGNINFTAISTGTSHSWSGPLFTSVIQNPSIANAGPANSGDYIVTASKNGCHAKDTVAVLVKPKPVLTVVTNSSPVCETGNVNFTVQSASLNNYSWMGPSSYSSSLQNPVINNVSIANSGAYAVTAILNGCTSAPVTTNVIINPMPAKPTATNNSPVCTGGILALFANSSTSGVSYKWSGPNSYASTQQNPTMDPVPANGSGKYWATATLGNCTSDADTTIAVVNTVTYLGAYASPNDTICEGSLITVVTVPVNGGSSPQFQWYKNNAQIAGATNLTYPTSSVVTGDSFYCRMIAGNICNTPVTLFSDKIGVTVLPKTPAPTISIASNPAQPLPGNSVVFTATTTIGGSNPQLQWQRNGGDIVGATANTWSAINLLPYDKISARLTVAEPCPDANPVSSNSIMVNFPTGINDANSKTGFYVYPNPNNGSFSITGNTAAKEVELQVLNAVGQVVYRETLQPAGGQVHTSIQTQLPKGVYLLSLQGAGISEKLRVVVQ